MLGLVNSSFLQPSATSVAAACRLLRHLIDPVLQSLLTSLVSSATSKGTSGSQATMFEQVNVLLALQYLAEVALHCFADVEFPEAAVISSTSELTQSLAGNLVFPIAKSIESHACTCHYSLTSVFAKLATQPESYYANVV